MGFQFDFGIFFMWECFHFFFLVLSILLYVCCGSIDIIQIENTHKSYKRCLFNWLNFWVSTKWIFEDMYGFTFIIEHLRIHDTVIKKKGIHGKRWVFFHKMKSDLTYQSIQCMEINQIYKECMMLLFDVGYDDVFAGSPGRLGQSKQLLITFSRNSRFTINGMMESNGNEAEKRRRI